jgi:hypothetical protein
MYLSKFPLHPKPTSKPFGFWKYRSNQRQFFEELAQSLHLSRLEDLSKLSLQKVTENGGSFVKTHFNGSLKKGKYS